MATAYGQSFWSGGTSDYNNAASWSGAFNSGNPNCCNDSGSANVVLIQPNDPPWIHGDTLAGQGNGASGSYLQTGSTNDTGYPNNGNWMRLGIGSGGVGYYTLSNGVVNVAGQTHLGEQGTGTLEVDGGIYTTGYNGNPGLCAGDGDMGPNPVGTLILTGGSITNINNETWFGEGGGTGYLNMSGGTINTFNWFVFGRNGGTGVGTMSAGTITESGGGNFLVGGGGNGTLTQSGGSINVINGCQFLCPQGGPGSGTYNLSGTGSLLCNSWLTIGRGGVGILNMSGGMIAKNDTGGDHIDIGAGGSSSGTGPGTINQTGGIITNTTTDLWMGEVANATWTFSGGTNYLRNLVICQGSGLQATFTLNGGFLSVVSITSAQPNSSYSTLNINGGTIQASGNNASFINNISSCSLQSGGVTIDTQAYNVTIPEAIADGGGGPLTKIGSGTLTLSGGNSYSGATILSNGELSTTTASAGGGGSYSTMDGTTLDVAVSSSGGYLPASSLTLGSSSGATLQIDLGNFGNPTAAPIKVSGALTVNGTVLVNITDSVPAVGQFKLISYGSLTPGGTIQLGSISPGMQASLLNDVASNSIDLVVTSAGAPYWNGNVAGGVWDVGVTANWIDLATASPETFHNGEPVLFNDNATGMTTVSLSGSVLPGLVTINNNALPYTFTGSGSIGGTTGLTKEGTNTLTIANTGNTYTGATVIDGGVLSVSSLANGGAASAIGESSSNSGNLVLAGGTLSYTGAAAAINRGYTDADTNAIVDIDTEGNLSLSGNAVATLGSGFTKGGPAQLAYIGNGTNILSDALGYTVAQGTVLFNGVGSGQTNNIVGNLDVGIAGSTNAGIVLSNNTTVAVVTGGLVDVGDGKGVAGSGAISVSGGTLNAGTGQIWIGQGANGVGTLNLTGGTFYADNWLAVGRASGTGTLNISGNAVLVDGGGGGNMDIGTSGGIGGVAGTGTLNQTGGAITNTASEVWLGEGSGGQPTSGTWNMSGGTAVVGEVHVGVGGTATSTLNVSGSASITESYLLLANYDGATTGNVNIGSASQPGGTITVGADMNIGGQGNGTLNFVTNGGGTLTVTGTIYLSRFSQTADGTVNLNAGGTLIAGYINNGWGFQNNYPTQTNNPNAFNFNGGTLRAYTGSTFFIQPYVNTVVQAGGAIIDDGGYAVSINSMLVNGGGGGGLTKLGSGALTLNGVNTYTGTTVVSNGGLAIGPSGSIAGPVVIASGGALLGDSGTIGTSYIDNTLTFNPGGAAVMKLTPSSNDQIAGLTGVSYAGSLVVTNTSASPLVPGDVYKLFNCATLGTGNFASVTILPSGMGTFNPANGTLTITAPPSFSSAVLNNGHVVITGSGGVAGAGYTLLSTTNITTPLPKWVTNAAGTFSGTGAFTNTIPVTSNLPALFFELRTP